MQIIDISHSDLDPEEIMGRQQLPPDTRLLCAVCGLYLAGNPGGRFRAWSVCGPCHNQQANQKQVLTP